MKRRDLIRKIVAGSTTIMILPAAITGCSEKEEDNGGNGGGTPSEKLTIDLTNQTYSALNSAGGFVVIAAKEIIVANNGTSFLALSSKCTHDGCSVTYSAANNNFPCPCHQSVFSSTGAVVKGPAAKALKSYSVTRSGNILTINL